MAAPEATIYFNKAGKKIVGKREHFFFRPNPIF
jgi:hypothetical protein